jgi:hypothetical protein
MLASLVLVAVALGGCETTAEKSARLEKAAKARSGAPRTRAAQSSIKRESTKIRVSSASLVHSAEGNAAIVTMHNASPTPLRNIPIQITVRDARGGSIYTNNGAGLAASLISAPLVPAHGTLTWIDDQVQTAGTGVSVSARVGEGEAVTGAIPALVVQAAPLSEEPTSGPDVEGSVVNHSPISQHELVIYALARRAGKIVAAGRGVIPQATAGASTHFQVFFIGDPRGAQLQVSAPVTTFG